MQIVSLLVVITIILVLIFFVKGRNENTNGDAVDVDNTVVDKKKLTSTSVGHRIKKKNGGKLRSLLELYRGVRFKKQLDYFDIINEMMTTTHVKVFWREVLMYNMFTIRCVFINLCNKLLNLILLF